MPSSSRVRSLAVALVIAGAAAASPPAALAANPAGQIVVRGARGGRPSALRAAVHAAGARIVGSASGGRVIAQAGADGLDGAIARLRRHRAVAAAAPRLVARIAADGASAVPDDTGLAGRSAASAGGWAQAQWDLTAPYGIDAPAAWALAHQSGRAPGAGVTVAVLDTGLAYANRPPFKRSPDISPLHVVHGWDFVDEDGFPNDRNGHGTFVAATIIATPNNGYGMVGIAYGARVMPVRVLDGDGLGTAGRIARGMRWAVDHGANVLNVSIELYDTITGQPQSMTVDPLIRDAVRYAAHHDVAVVAAAGNAGNPDVPSTRLGADIIYVGGSTEHGCLGDYSNFGHGLDLVAPGGGPDADIAGDPKCQPNGPSGRNVLQVTFKRPSINAFRIIRDSTGKPGLHGTSMAAPHVAAAVALLLGAGALGPHPTPGAIQARLIATTRPLAAASSERYYGAGLLDAAAALSGIKPTA